MTNCIGYNIDFKILNNINKKMSAVSQIFKIWHANAFLYLPYEIIFSHFICYIIYLSINVCAFSFTISSSRYEFEMVRERDFAIIELHQQLLLKSITKPIFWPTNFWLHIYFLKKYMLYNTIFGLHKYTRKLKIKNLKITKLLCFKILISYSLSPNSYYKIMLLCNIIIFEWTFYGY